MVGFENDIVHPHRTPCKILTILSHAVMISVVLVATVFSAHAETASVRLSRGYGILYLPLIVMEDQKLLEKQAAVDGLGNLKTEWFLFDGGNVINDAMLAGTLDIAGTGAPGFITLWSKTQGIASAQVTGVSGLSSTALILTTNDASIKTLADFKPSHRIALPGIKTSLSAVILQMLVAKTFGPDNFNKLDPLTVSLAHPDAVASLLSGRTEITAHLTSPPFSYVELKSDKIFQIVNSVDVLGNITLDVVYARKAFAEANPKVMQAFLAAQEQANALIKANPKLAAEIFIRTSKLKVFESEVLDILRDQNTHFSTTPTEMMDYVDFLARAGTIKQRPLSWKEFFIPAIHEKSGS